MTTGSRPVATWRCPHCGAAQPESGRCWVCHRPSTFCATCTNFRPSLVGGLGYCGLDRTRAPLRGTELRGCWEPAAPRVVTLFDRPVGRAPAVGERDHPQPRDWPPRDATALRRPLEWVPVEESADRGSSGSTRP